MTWAQDGRGAEKQSDSGVVLPRTGWVGSVLSGRKCPQDVSNPLQSPEAPRLSELLNLRGTLAPHGQRLASTHTGATRPPVVGVGVAEDQVCDLRMVPACWEKET